MFDLPGNPANYKSDKLMEIQNKCDVSVNLRVKGKQNSMVCIIKGAERNASKFIAFKINYSLFMLISLMCLANIYRARNMVLQLEEPNFVADIPPSYHMRSHDLLTPTPMQPHSTSCLTSPTWQYPPASFNQAQSVQPFMGFSMGQSLFPFNNKSNTSSQNQNSMGSSGYYSLGQISASSLSLEKSRDGNNYSLSTISSNGSLSNKSSPAQSPRKQQPYYQRNYNESVKGLVNLNLNEYKNPVDQEATPSEYESKRMAGFLAMQNRPSGNQFRYPNSNWAGYGISHTSPNPLIDKVNTTSEQVPLQCYYSLKLHSFIRIRMMRCGSLHRRTFHPRRPS